MNAVERIRQRMMALDIYPAGEVNACAIFKDHQGWQIQRFGELPWCAGATVSEALDTLQEIIDGRDAAPTRRARIWDDVCACGHARRVHCQEGCFACEDEQAPHKFVGPELRRVGTLGAE